MAALATLRVRKDDLIVAGDRVLIRPEGFVRPLGISFDDALVLVDWIAQAELEEAVADRLEAHLNALEEAPLELSLAESLAVKDALRRNDVSEHGGLRSLKNALDVLA